MSSHSTIPLFIREYVFGCSIFMSHAEFENYFVDVIDRVARLYSIHSPTVAAFPDNLRAHVFLSRSSIQRPIANYMAGGDEQALLRNITSVLGGAGAAMLPSTAPPPSLTRQDVAGSLTYPSTDNLVQVLRRIGIGDPKGKINKVAKSDAWALLQSVASLRTALAHAASLPGVSEQDLIARLKGLTKFVAAMDRTLYEHLRSSHGNAAWVAVMP
jgi:hypothetical protein